MRQKPQVLFIGQPSQRNCYLLREIEPLVELKAIVWEHGTRRNQVRRIARRSKKLGWFYPASRLLLQIYVWLFQRSARKQCSAWNEIQSASFRGEKCREVRATSVNDDCVRELLASTRHDLVVVHGASIIRPHILRHSQCTVNLHAGITPEYRGAHGAVWAAINRDYANAGVTLHFIDEGIDTGAVISQTRIAFAATDSLETVAAKQLVAGVGLLKEFLLTHNPPFADCPRIDTSQRRSKLYYSPTFRQYLRFLGNIRECAK